MSILKLKEVLWEITPRCNKNCSYCGSKEITSKDPLKKRSLKCIAKQLVECEIKEVTLTGGEPGILLESNPDTFVDVVNVLADAGIEVKAITNGKLAEVMDKLMITNRFSVIGFSINTLEDIDNLYNSEYHIDENTMVTNFGKHNVWDFDEFAKCAKEFSCWQIQLTMGDNLLNEDGIKYLMDKISKCDVDFMVLADNLQTKHKCSAGIRSCSITYDGDVIACLSERSYGGIQRVYGNLLSETLKDIWENEFKDIRFDGCRKCCRDYIKYPDKIPERTHINDVICRPQNDWEQTRPQQIDIVLYAVFNRNVHVYGVKNHICR